MHNKWYSLTRPAVVHFNPPRDTSPVLGTENGSELFYLLYCQSVRKFLASDITISHKQLKQ